MGSLRDAGMSILDRMLGRTPDKRSTDRRVIQESMSCGIIRANDGKNLLQGDGFMPAGRVRVGLWRDPNFKNGKVSDAKAFKQLAEYEFPNLVVNQGKNDNLDVYFNSGTQTVTSSWFMGLITDTGFTSIQATDTAASHSGWSEFTGYSQSTRPLWGQGSASGQAVTNASAVIFTINASATVRGGFIITNSTKSGTTGKLWAAALFSAGVPVNNGDELRCTYTLST
jgi:hypothetical protein